MAAGVAGGLSYAELSRTAPAPPAGRRPGPVALGHPATPTSTPTSTVPPPPEELELPTAAWVQAENARPGSTGWVVTGTPVPHAIEGYADHVSATAGDTVTLYVNTAEPSFHVEAWRMGWYQGHGGRLVWRSAPVPGRVQPPAALHPGVNTIECAWAPSLRFTVPVDRSWPPGNYLLKLVGAGGQQQYVPITLRDDSSEAAVLVMNSVTTWQAYNLWQGYSLYLGPQGRGQAYSRRSRVVSFDRPYALADVDWANGAADWMGNEFPFLMLAERWGLDLAYWTDIDMAAAPERLLSHRVLVSLGHDEYWSAAMLYGALYARQRGVNFAFLGANAVFRHIRLAASPTGPARRVVCYKDAAEDPLLGVNNADVTADWPSGPNPRPESILIGNMYQSNPVDAPLVLTAPQAWGLAGLDVRAGTALAHLVGTEYDGFDPALPGPRNVEIWAHSPLECQGRRGYADVTYYAVPGAGGVFATGTNWWVTNLGASVAPVPPALVPRPVPGVSEAVSTITRNVLTVLGHGPAGLLRPSAPTWPAFYGPGRSSGPAGIQGA